MIAKRPKRAPADQRVRDCVVALVALRGWDEAAMRRIGRLVLDEARKSSPRGGEGAIYALGVAMEGMDGGSRQ